MSMLADGKSLRIKTQITPQSFPDDNVVFFDSDLTDACSGLVFLISLVCTQLPDDIKSFQMLLKSGGSKTSSHHNLDATK